MMTMNLLLLLIGLQVVMPLLMVVVFRNYLEIHFQPKVAGRDGVPGGRTGTGTGTTRSPRRKAVEEEEIQVAGRDGVPGRRVGGGSRLSEDPETEQEQEDFNA